MKYAFLALAVLLVLAACTNVPAQDSTLPVTEPVVNISPEPQPSEATTPEAIAPQTPTKTISSTPPPSENTDSMMQPDMMTPSYSLTEVSLHADSSSCWTTIQGQVYDLTDWIRKHPGGAGNILKICGIDGTKAFERQHGRSTRAQITLGEFSIGNLA